MRFSLVSCFKTLILLYIKFYFYFNCLDNTTILYKYIITIGFYCYSQNKVDLIMIFPLLSYFNQVSGPTILLKAPELENSTQMLNHIPSLMDLYNEGFFIHEYGGIRSINHIFEISSPLTRGKVELLMISLVCFDDQYNLNSFKEILDFFIIQFQKIPDVYKAFQHVSKNPTKFNEKSQEILKLFYSFNRSLTKNKTLFTYNTNRSLIYGLSHLGKEYVIKSIQKNLINAKISFDNPTISEKFDFI